MTSDTKQCVKCRQLKPIAQFKTTNCPFLPGKRSLICTPCLETMVPPTNLDKVSALMQHLDLPFDANRWTQLYEVHGPHTLSAYFDTLDEKASFAPLDSWAAENERWRLAREQQTIDAQMEVLDQAKIHELHKRWSPSYTKEELLWLEDYYNQILATQNVSTPILQSAASDLCEIELQIREGLRKGEDVKKYLDARDNMIKVYNFTASNSKNAADFDSVGELITYCVKKGWHPSYHIEPKDSIDFLMENNQAYLRRLVQNEGNFADQVEDKRAQYNLAERLEGEDEDYQYEAEEEELEYENEDELEVELCGTE